MSNSQDDHWKIDRERRKAFSAQYYTRMRIGAVLSPLGEVEIEEKTVSQWADDLSIIPRGASLEDQHPTNIRTWMLRGGYNMFLATKMQAHARFQQGICKAQMEAVSARARRDFRASYAEGGSNYDPKNPKRKPGVQATEDEAEMAIEDLKMQVVRFDLEMAFFTGQVDSIRRQMTACKAYLDNVNAMRFENSGMPLQSREQVDRQVQAYGSAASGQRSWK